MPPDTISHYRVVDLLGSGGMGEVYRARDPRLEREVAVKVLPAEFSADRMRLSRFQQEARSVSALNHPNIVTIYDVGEEEAGSYIIMELVEGRTLRELLGAGPLAVKKAAHIAAQVADGLAKAHAAGIVHRDLKPENVMVTRDNLVKVLDFGLAKLTAGLAGGGDSLATAAGPGTHPGMVLGTVGYMSPEQARGAEADFRSDQFSLGVVLYEMLTGARPFAGESSAQTMTAIIEDDPRPVAELNPKVPLPLRWIVERCLAKDPEERYASTRDLARDLQSVRDHISEAASSDTALHPPQAATRRKAVPLGWVLVGAAAGALLAGAAAWQMRPGAAEPPSLRALTFSGSDSQPAVSPDGRLLAFTSERDGTRRIWVKQLPGGDEAPLTGGPGDESPRFSPDGSSILFTRWERGVPALYRASLVGSQERRLVPEAGSGEWSPDGTQLAFLRWGQREDEVTSAVWLAAADGSGAREVKRFLGRRAAGLRWAPDGQRLSLRLDDFGAGGGRRAAVLLSADGAREEEIAPWRGGVISSTAAMLDTGELFYVVSETTAFSADSTSASSRVVRQSADGRRQTLLWLAAQSRTIEVAGPGKLVFDIFTPIGNLRQMDLRGRGGAERQRWLTQGSSVDRQPIYTPDGRTVVFTSSRTGDLEVWALNLEDGRLRRLTDDPAQDWDPAFSRDGRLLVWSSNRSGNFEIWVAEADGSRPRQVTRDGVDAENPTFTADGQWIVYNSGNPERRGVWKIRLDGSEDTLLARGSTGWPEASPDGRYALYTFQAPGANSVRVVRLADSQVLPLVMKVQGGGTGRARWMPDGRAIAYVDWDDAGVAGVFVEEFAPGGEARAPRRKLAGFDPERTAESFSVSPDGERITISFASTATNLMLAEGVPGVALPRRR